MKLILDLASSKPVFIASHTPPSSHNISPPPNALHQSPPRPVGHGHESDVAGVAATTARPGGPSRLCFSGLLPLMLCLLRVCRHHRIPCSRPSLCVSPLATRPPFRVLPLCMNVSRVSRYRHAQARTFTRPSDRWKPMPCEKLPYSSKGEVL